MRIGAEIKADLLEALAEVADEDLAQVGFVRGKKTYLYKRNRGIAKQIISFTSSTNPRYQRDSEIHIYPMMQLMMPEISQVALRLVSNEAGLLSGHPEIVFNQPVHFVAPKTESHEWYASGIEDIKSKVSLAKDFVIKWVLPLFDEIYTTTGLIRLYERSDPRVVKQERFYIYVAAAYLVNSQKQEALEVIDSNFKTPSAKKKYKSVSDYLSKE